MIELIQRIGVGILTILLVGSRDARPSGRRGRRFNSCRPDYLVVRTYQRGTPHTFWENPAKALFPIEQWQGGDLRSLQTRTCGILRP